jgi:hypothetical protein
VFNLVGGSSAIRTFRVETSGLPVIGSELGCRRSVEDSLQSVPNVRNRKVLRVPDDRGIPFHEAAPFA